MAVKTKGLKVFPRNTVPFFRVLGNKEGTNLGLENKLIRKDVVIISNGLDGGYLL